MKQLFFIIVLSFLPCILFSQLEEKALLSSINKTLHEDFAQVDSVLNEHRKQYFQLSKEGQFEFLLLELAYLSTTEKYDYDAFRSYIDTLSILAIDATILENIGATLNNLVTSSQSLYDIQYNALTSDRKALVRVFNGFMSDRKLTREREFQAALKLSRKSSMTIIPSIVFNIIAEKQKQIGNYKEAVKSYQKAINYSRGKNHNLCELQFSLAMAQIQLEMDNLKKAEGFFLQSIKLANVVNNDWHHAASMRGIGNMYLKLNQTEKGISNFQKALAIYYRVNSEPGIARTHKDIGKAYLLTGEIELAERNFELSKTYYDKFNTTNGEEDELYENFAKLRFQQGRSREALRLINKAIDIRKSASDKRLELYETYEIRSEIYAKMGLGNQAYKDLAAYSKFKDSLYSAKLQHQIAELSELYESEQKSKQIIEQEQRLKEERSERLLREKELENTRLRNRQIILIFSFSLLLLLAVFFIFYFKNKQRQLKRRQTEVELRQQLLRSQMNPHFVFNAMSVIQSYIYDKDTEKSSEFLVSLSRLMRLILENSSKETIKLSTELEILERFLFIQQERFENRFSFEIEALSNVDVEQVAIPPMILQPFLENATEHGELDKVVNGKIRITYKIENQLLIFVIEDNGIGRKAAQNKGARSNVRNHKSMAISITEKRIELMRQKYNKKGYIRIEDLNKEEESGTKVTVAMPLINE